jgi:hypothetical protein
MRSMMIEWCKRLIGYGAAAASGIVATKADPELAAWIGSGVAIVGGMVLNKALPYIIPTASKLQPPKAGP